MGLNKPYNTMTPGYQTSNPSFYHIDLELDIPLIHT
jgi:hypothetical protein